MVGDEDACEYSPTVGHELHRCDAKVIDLILTTAIATSMGMVVGGPSSFLRSMTMVLATLIELAAAEVRI